MLYAIDVYQNTDDILLWPHAFSKNFFFSFVLLRPILWYKLIVILSLWYCHHLCIIIIFVKTTIDNWINYVVLSSCVSLICLSTNCNVMRSVLSWKSTNIHLSYISNHHSLMWMNSNIFFSWVCQLFRQNTIIHFTVCYLWYSLVSKQEFHFPVHIRRCTKRIVPRLVVEGVVFAGRPDLWRHGLLHSFVRDGRTPAE